MTAPAESTARGLEGLARRALARLGLAPPDPVIPAPSPPPPAGWGLIALALALAFVGHLQPITGFDLYTHLAVGDWILDHAAAPTTGLFSATRGSAAWVDNEWGFQAALALAFRAGGFPAVVLVSAALPTAALGVLAWFLRDRRWPGPAVALAVGALAVGIGTHSGRPQLITALALAGTLVGVADLSAGRRLAPCLWLPPLIALWANLHAGFVVGLVAVFVPGAVEAARRVARRPAQAPLGPLALTAAVCLVAAFCNAYGWKQVVYPLEYALRPKLTAFNLEWGPTVLAKQPVLVGLLFVGPLAFVAAWRLDRGGDGDPREPAVRLHELALFGAFAFLATRAQRHVGISLFALAVAVGPAAARLFARLPAPSRRGGVLLRAGTIGALLLGFVGTRGIPLTSPFREDLGLALPRQAAERYAALRPPGALFNQYAWGGYLIFRFRPEAVVFVDGRNDLYGEAFMADYLATLAAEPGTAERLDRWGIGAVLLAESLTNAPLLRLLAERGWRLDHRSLERGVPVVLWVRPD